MSYDPLPAIRELRAMIEVKHANDRLAIDALRGAEEGLMRGDPIDDVRGRVRFTWGTMRMVSRVDAAAALELAYWELGR